MDGKRNRFPKLFKHQKIKRKFFKLFFFKLVSNAEEDMALYMV